MLNPLMKFLGSLFQPFPPFLISNLKEKGDLNKVTSILIIDTNDKSRLLLYQAIRNIEIFDISTAASVQESYDRVKEADILIYLWHRHTAWTEANRVISSWRTTHAGPICILTPFLEAHIRRSFYVSGVSNVLEVDTSTVQSTGEESLVDIETVLAVLLTYERTEAFRRMIDEYSRREDYILEYLELSMLEISRLRKYVPLSLIALALLLFLQLSGQEIPWDLVLSFYK